MKITNSQKVFQLPASKNNDDTFLLYAFNGTIKVNNEIALNRGESLLIKNEAITLMANPSAELVLFITNEHTAYYAEGMYSGKQLLQKNFRNKIPLQHK
ncbi:MAG: hypothetical protein WKG06_08885 [Segetibacter sp.]